MRKLFLISVFLIITPLFIVLSLFFLVSLNNAKNGDLSKTIKQDVLYAALPTSQNSVEFQVEQKDMRVEILTKFFQKYQSPLEPYSQNIVSIADKYSLDFRLVPAIAMQESNLCKKTPKDSFNCWGFGVYGTKVKRFENYSDAIEAVSKTLAQSYKENGLDTPEEIMTKYTPSSNGSWAKSVNFFMNQLQVSL